MSKHNQSRFVRGGSTLVGSAAIVLSLFSTPALAGNAGAFLGGMITSRVLGNMEERTQAEQVQAAASVQRQAPPPSRGGGSSVEGRLNTLDKLRADGTISKKEYDERRKAILNNI